MKEFIKRNSKYILIVMICIFGSYLTTLATNYAFESSDVRFDNTNTEITAGDVQGALEQTFQHVTDYNDIKDIIGSGSLTTTSQTLIGAINGLNDYIGNVGATDLQTQINTINGKIGGSGVSSLGYGLGTRIGVMHDGMSVSFNGSVCPGAFFIWNAFQPNMAFIGSDASVNMMVGKNQGINVTKSGSVVTITNNVGWWYPFALLV